MLFLIGFGGLFGLYFIFGMYANVQAGKSNPIPNAQFWGSLGGLIRDGISFTAGAEVEKPEPASNVGINDDEGLSAPVLQSQAAPDGRRVKRSPGGRKKKPSQEGEKIIVVDPVTGKKKV